MSATRYIVMELDTRGWRALSSWTMESDAQRAAQNLRAQNPARTIKVWDGVGGRFVGSGSHPFETAGVYEYDAVTDSLRCIDPTAVSGYSAPTPDDAELYASFAAYCEDAGAYVVSDGTLRASDLIQAFLSQLEDMGWESMADGLREDYAEVMGAIDNNLLSRGMAEDVGCMIEDLYDTLNELAPAGFYFASSEGDGACFGFWQEV